MSTKMHLEWDEAYPVYILSDPNKSRYGMEVDVPDDLMQRYLLSKEEWEQVQDELQELRFKEQR